MPKCPACGGNSTVYKCDNCGDVRCGLPLCSGTMGGPKGGTGGGEGRTCKVCKKGKYKKIM